jgi:hypothetical protein
MMTKRYPSRDGVFAATVTPQLLKETDSLRGDLPRSRWVERALIMYNASVKREAEKGGNMNVNFSPRLQGTSMVGSPERLTVAEDSLLADKSSIALEEAEDVNR